MTKQLKKRVALLVAMIVFVMCSAEQCTSNPISDVVLGHQAGTCPAASWGGHCDN
jgi:hypothetical protein